MIIEVPVFGDSDLNKPPIGSMRIELTALPAKPEFCFALMYKEHPENHKWALKAVFVSSDETYRDYLDHIKKET